MKEPTSPSKHSKAEETLRKGSYEDLALNPRKSSYVV
jgi:hypothetical protein